MSELDRLWTCSKCGGVIRTGNVKSTPGLEMTFEVTHCTNPECDGEMKLSLAGVPGFPEPTDD